MFSRSSGFTLILRLGTALVLAGAAVLFFSYGFGRYLFKQNSGSFERQQFEAIVAQIRLAGLKQGETKVFFASQLSDPKSIQPVDASRGYWTTEGTVWAEMTPQGALKVVIDTRSMGHLGSYGFAYSDIPLSPEPYGDGGSWYRLDVPGRLFLTLPKMKIDDHWWKVLNNLD